MASPRIEWNCSECQSVVTDQRKYCAVCHSMLRWACSGSGRSGLYTNYYRHRSSCSFCIVEMDENQQQEIREKELSIQQEFNTLDDKQRPWSEWQQSDESCVQHTEFDVDQIQELYAMREEPPKKYRLHRYEQQTDLANRSYLSPMNLLVVTLWYLKHYHFERYISLELNLSQSTVKYFLREVLEILHSCIYQELVFIPADISSTRSKHGPEQHHKLIVDSTSIAIPEPYDSEQRKAYYYGKSLTNYAIKVQITCDFNHQIVHVSDCYRGSTHDITILRDSGLLDYLDESVQIIADKAYIGEEYVITPKKKPHGRELTDEEKNDNRDINSARAAIENINQRLKTYAILGNIYRGAIDDFCKITKIVQVVSALCNINLQKHPIRRFT